MITLAFAVGTGYQHTTFGLYVTAFVLSVLVVGGLRAAYELVTRDVWRLAGVRRRAVLLGSGERLVDLRRALGLGRGGIDYEFLGAVVSDGDEIGHARARHASTTCPRAARAPAPRRADRQRRRSRRRGVARSRRAGAPVRREGADRADDDGAPDAARRVRPGAGRAALRAAPAGLRRARLDGQARASTSS